MLNVIKIFFACISYFLSICTVLMFTTTTKNICFVSFLFNDEDERRLEDDDTNNRILSDSHQEKLVKKMQQEY